MGGLTVTEVLLALTSAWMAAEQQSYTRLSSYGILHSAW